MTSPLILVTGGTGTLGRQVVSRLRDAGREVRVLSRQGHGGPEFVTGDLATGEGLPAAVAGAGIIVHCASSRKATRKPRETSCGRRSRRTHRTWSTSRSSASTGSRAATTKPSSKPKA